jgi:anti-sigma regulatory factor (Ser/Thr protein kinase)
MSSVNESGFRHEALFYADDEEFLAGTVPIVREGLEASGSSLIAVRRHKSELLRSELGDDGAAVEFVDMEVVGRNPARIIPVWRDFLERTGGSGAPVLGIGEPAWPGRNPVELEECRRHEALLNSAFAPDREWSLLCPYDSAALDDDVLERACESHSHVRSHGARVVSPTWSGPVNANSPLEGLLPEAPGDSRTVEFGRDGLAQARALVAREAALAALSGYRGLDMVVAVSELAANSVLHGGGRGTLRVWRELDALVAEVRDRGRIEQPLAGRLRPGVAQGGGRGLWMVNQLCDLVQIRSGPEGTGVRVRMGLG